MSQMIMVFSVFISIGLAIYTYRLKKVKSALQFSIVFLFITLISISNLFEVTMDQLADKFFWRKISQTIGVWIFPSFLSMVYVLTESKLFNHVIKKLITYILPTIWCILIWMNHSRFLFTKEIYIYDQNLVIIRTPIGQTIAVFNYLYIVLAIVILICYYKRVEKALRKKAIGIIIGAVIPTVVVFLRELDKNIAHFLPPIPVFFAISGVLIFWSVFRHQLFSIIPVARDKVMECIDEGIIIVNNLGRVIDKNDAVDRFIFNILGETRDILDRSVDKIFRTWPEWSVACKEMVNKDFEVETSMWGEKRYYKVKVYPLQGKDQIRRGTVSVIFDITDTKKREVELFSTVELNKEQLKVQNQQLEAIVNSMSDMAVLSISDCEGNLLQYSDSINTYFLKNTYKAKLGETYRRGVFFHHDGSEVEYSELPGIRVLRGEKVSNFYFVMKDPNEEKHFLSNGTPVYDKDGNLTYGVFFTLDITEHILNKKLVMETEHLAALNDFKNSLIAIISHDIRNPIANLMSMMELLESENERMGGFNEIFTAVKDQVRNTYFMIDNLIDWSRTQKDGLIYKPEFVNLRRIAEESYNLYKNKAESKRIHFSMEIDKDVKVFADREVLEILLRNLINNALKYTDQGDTITIKAIQSEDQFIVAVSDTGRGIEPQRATKLFDKLTDKATQGTAGEKGTGLGLIICRDIIQQNGGKIWVESILGEGSTFYFTLPSEKESVNG